MPYLEDPGKQNTTASERNWAMWAHMASMCYMLVPGYLPFATFLGAFIVWGFKGRSSPYVRVHAARSVNFQIPMSLIMYLSVALDQGLLGVEIGKGGQLAIYMTYGFHMLMTLCAAFLALDGRFWRYPFQVPVVRERAKAPPATDQ